MTLSSPESPRSLSRSIGDSRCKAHDLSWYITLYVLRITFHVSDYRSWHDHRIVKDNHNTVVNIVIITVKVFLILGVGNR